MQINCRIQAFQIKDKSIELFVPVTAVNIPSVHSPYWARLWPSATGLCYFLADNTHYINSKNIVELAAGLGLPSIYAAAFATQVTASDIEPNAVELVQQSAQHNQLQNLTATVIDWRNAEEVAIPDVLLLSDINYEPAAFAALEKAINYFLERETTIILSTPQRLMAKDFISQLLPWCRQQAEVMVTQDAIETAISVFVLKK
jgi:methyltransferase-like protein 23